MWNDSWLSLLARNLVTPYLGREPKAKVTTLMVIKIYGRSTKAFILVVTNGLGNNDAHALSFYSEFNA
jgi:hypothetical protein